MVRKFTCSKDCVELNFSPSQKINSSKHDIAQWIFLRLPFCGPGFKSQAHHLDFYVVKFSTIFAGIVLTEGRKSTKRGRV